MPEFEFTSHAKDMRVERNILEDWIWRVLKQPDKMLMGKDGNMHYSKAINEQNGRVLHVVINPNFQPNRIITMFLDRRFVRPK